MGKSWIFIVLIFVGCTADSSPKTHSTSEDMGDEQPVDMDRIEEDFAQDSSDSSFEDMGVADLVEDRDSDVHDMEQDQPPEIDPQADQDGDGFSNEEEGAPQRDTDGDLIPDYLDLDSDNDGLADAAELQHGTSPRVVDTDGDGEWDVLEVHSNTDPLDPLSNLGARGVVVVMMAPDQPSTAPVHVSLRPRIQDADIYLSLDASGSMQGVHQYVANAAPAVDSQLLCDLTGVPCEADEECASDRCSQVGFCVEDSPCLVERSVEWGFGRWLEIDSFENVVSPTSNLGSVVAQINTGALSGQNEAMFQAAACIADGNNCASTNKNCSSQGVGCPGFRPNAYRVLLHFTDESDQCVANQTSTCPASGIAGGELMRQGIRFVGFFDEEGITTSRFDLIDLANQAGSFDSQGNPHAYGWNLGLGATGMTLTLFRALESLMLSGSLEAQGLIEEQDADDGNVEDFLTLVEADTSPNGCTALPTKDKDGDSIHETFQANLQSNLCWRLEFSPNTILPRIETIQEVRGRFEARGVDGVLASRPLRLVVPPIVAQQ